jgi:hypothetical protein
MARRRSQVDQLAERIIALEDADRAKLLARLMVEAGTPGDWSVLARIRRRVAKRRARSIDQLAVSAVRDARRARR